MAGAAGSAAGKANALWLVGYFVLSAVGELHLAPVGLALISRLAPAGTTSIMMGVWFSNTLSPGGFAGFLWGFLRSIVKADFFLYGRGTGGVRGPHPGGGEPRCKKISNQ